MKRLLLTLLLLAFSLQPSAFVRGADNDYAAGKFNGDTQNQIKLKTTDTAGVHTPHVIVDAGSTPASATTVKSTALEASHVLKASAGSLVSIHVYNSKASAQYILILDSATLTADGAVVLLYPPIYVPATSNVALSFFTPLAAANGITVCNSSTGSFTKTLGSADCVFVAQVQ